MLITKKSIISGNINTRDISITQEQYDLWTSGTLIQDVVPDLSKDDREFLISGITPEEWDSVFNT